MPTLRIDLMENKNLTMLHQSTFSRSFVQVDNTQIDKINKEIEEM
jgi:hypothetical protein